MFSMFIYVYLVYLDYLVCPWIQQSLTHTNVQILITCIKSYYYIFLSVFRVALLLTILHLINVKVRVETEIDKV